MKKALYLIPIVAIIAYIGNFYTQATQYNSNPVGSYQLSCEDIQVENNQLTASCETLDGSYQQTTLNNLYECLNSISSYGDIGNIDGSLMCLPDLPIVDSNFSFPKSEITINDWVYNEKPDEIYKHGWGLWAGITSFVGETDGTQVRAFETWSTISNMLYQIENNIGTSGTSNTADIKMKSMSHSKDSMKLELSTPRQFRNMDKIKGNLKNAIQPMTEEDGDTNIFVSVAYNPPAARHAITNKLFLQSTLNDFLKRGYTEIPNFPVNAITIKPVYKVISMANTKDGIYTIPGWPGPPTPPKAFSEQDWDHCVYVNVTGSGKGGNSIDAGCQNRDDSNTFFLNNFIHQKIDSENANYLTQQLGIKVADGDYAVLIGMHVTTRETKRWTWQTFWWSASPDSPQLPSTSDIAQYRSGSTLDASAQHYAMSVAYQMVSPAQPITGGQSIGSSVYGYNPHLEAGFGPDSFQILVPVNGKQINNYGVETNCMTCHNLASYNPKWDYTNGDNREKPYGSDYYMSIDDPTFDQTLRLDFAWSILGGLKLDDQ